MADGSRGANSITSCLSLSLSFAEIWVVFAVTLGPFDMSEQGSDKFYMCAAWPLYWHWQIWGQTVR